MVGRGGGGGSDGVRRDVVGVLEECWGDVE